MRPATGMAVLILLVAGVGAGYLLRGASTVEPVDVVKAEAIERRGRRFRRRSSAPATRRPCTSTSCRAIDDDEVYEVWVQRAGVMEPRSTFVLDIGRHRRGRGRRARSTTARRCCVTREPRGGSAQPTTEPVLAAPL